MRADGGRRAEGGVGGAPFNSLFEMQEEQAASRWCPPRERLSILYLRCLRWPVVPLYAVEDYFQFSI